MQLYTLNAEDWRMDGGAGFGLVPKTIWSKSYPADELNYIPMKSRCLLVKTEDRIVLIDTGMGRKRDEKYYGYKYIFGEDSLEKGFKDLGIAFSDVTDIILTHLHDDHVGGCVTLNKTTSEYSLVFPNAKHWISKGQWDWAMNPNRREAGTYFKDNFVPLHDAGKVVFVENEAEHIPGIFFKMVSGHTKDMIIPLVNFHGKTLAYMADFIPSTAHIPIPYIAAVDIVPLLSLEEKEAFLKEAAEKNIFMYFEHDFFTEICCVKKSEKGIVLDKVLTLNDFVNE